MVKNNIKRRHNKTLDLSSVKRYRPLSKNIYNGETNTGQQIAGSVSELGNVLGSIGGDGKGGEFLSKAGSVLGKAGAGLGAVSTFVDTFQKNSAIADTSGIESNIDATKNTDFSSANDTSSLLDSWNSINWQDAGYQMRDVRGSTVGQQIGNTLSATVQGAMAGAQIAPGPWGAIAGAAIGLGSGIAGIFTGNKKAKEKAAELNKAANIANMSATNNFDYTAENLEKQQYKDMLANVAKDGGKIHIKPSKRRTFTAAAKKHGKSVQAFASQVLANKENYSPAMVKKANFARNASKWKHSLGGFLYGEGGNLYSNVPDSQTHGTDFSNGMTFVNKGGTHEQNPLEGVQMGVDTQGVPNLVEEGEVIFNDYVFSNRLHPSEKELEKANLPKRYKGHTFALIAEDMGKESSERPNDPISKRGLEDSMMKLAMIQEAQRARKGKKGTQQMMAFGGRKYRGDLDVPYMIYDPYMGSPEQVAEEETFYDDLKKLTNRNMESLSPFIITAEGNPMPTIIDTNAYADFIGRVQDDERIRNFLASVPEMESEESVNALDEAFQKEATANLPQIVTPEGAASVSKNNNKNNNEGKSLPTYLRYVPTIGSAFGAIQSLFQKPDYENADILMQEARNLSRPSVRYRALNNYLTYRPLDRNYYLNQLKGQAGATRRGIMNSGSNAGNVMAGLLAADYNAQNAVGKTLMQMEQYNDAQRQRIAEFNRGTDQYNAQAAMSADAQNAQSAQNRDRLRSSLMTQAAQMREASDTALEATRSANLTNFFDNLGGIGRENMGWNWTKYLADSGAFGTLREEVPMPGQSKNGGLLTKRRRRRE